MNVIHKRMRTYMFKNCENMFANKNSRAFPFSFLNNRKFTTTIQQLVGKMESCRHSLFKQPKRFFSNRGKEKPVSKPAPSNYAGKKKFIKPSEVGAYSPTVEPIIQLENGYYLVYYHRQRLFTMLFLYLKFIIPIGLLIYLIKKNPFYKSYPAALPIMMVVLIVYFYRLMKYGSITNRMVHQILIDPSGTEITFVYKNRFARKMRNDNLEETMLIQALVNPPQGAEYTPLRGELFPEEYPYEFEAISGFNYFWLKYYISQQMFFAIAKKPNYVNYEILCNTFSTKTIDFSQAKIYKLMTSKLSQFQLEFILDTMNLNSPMNFSLRKERAEGLKKIVKETKDDTQEQQSAGTILNNKTYERIMSNKNQ